MTFLLYFHHFRLVFLAMSCTFVARLCISHPTLVDRWHRCVDAAKKIIRQHKIIIMIIMIQLKKKQCFSCENSQIRHFVAKIYKCGVFCHENLKHVYSEIQFFFALLERLHPGGRPALVRQASSSHNQSSLVSDCQIRS